MPLGDISQKELQQILQDKENEINRLRTKTEGVSNQASTSFGDCGICLNGYSDDRHQIVLIPCGHRCCHECAPRLYECHECRSNITSKVRLFV